MLISLGGNSCFVRLFDKAVFVTGGSFAIMESSPTSATPVGAEQSHMPITRVSLLPVKISLDFWDN
jgi:hypothetical protein